MGSRDADATPAVSVTVPAAAISPSASSTTTPSRPVPPRPPAAEGRSLRKFLPAILAAGVVLCLLAAAGGGLLAFDPFGWFGSGRLAFKPRATVVPTTPPPLPATLAVTPPATQVAALPTAMPLPVVLPTVTLEPATEPVLPTPTQMVTASLPVVPTQALSQTTLVEDDFNGVLNQNWLAWGNPRPVIDRGPTDSWLYVKAVDQPYSGGVTSKFFVPVSPGVEVKYEASLDKIFREAPLYFDWSPAGAEPGPQSQTGGVIHMEVFKNNLVVKNLPTRVNCMASVDGVNLHTYRLRFTEGGGVDFFIDDSPTPFCQMSAVGVKAEGGKISFAGAGWVTYVKVSGP